MSLLDTYLERLTHVLGNKAIASASPSLEPAVAQYAIATADLTSLAVPGDQIGLLDFLSLSGCALQINLGRRNSSLGRNASASQQLLLDLEFLRLASPCADRMRKKDPELAAKITDLARNREHALPRLIYNAILAGPEWRALWRIPAEMGDYPASTGDDIGDTLARLDRSVGRWLAGQWDADNINFEVLLNDLRAGDGGSLLLAAARQSQALDLATEVVDARHQTSQLCPFGKNNDTSRQLKNVVSRFFAGGVQPWLTDVRRREQVLIPPIKSLEEKLGATLPPAYQQWRSRRDELLSTLPDAPRAHALSISRALHPCGGIGTTPYGATPRG